MKVRINVKGWAMPRRGWAEVRHAWDDETKGFGHRAIVKTGRTTQRIWWEGPFRKTERECWDDIHARTTPEQQGDEP